MTRKLITLALCAGALALPAEGLADNPGWRAAVPLLHPSAAQPR
ncbi:MAG: hypothetical protein WKF94_12835 [Solirubrobacteraceae bacterium]